MDRKSPVNIVDLPIPLSVHEAALSELRGAIATQKRRADEAESARRDLLTENNSLGRRIQVLQLSLAAKQRELDLMVARYRLSLASIAAYEAIFSAVDRVVTENLQTEEQATAHNAA